MLRGFYFTSGTQEGTPIDRLTGAPGAHLRHRPAPRPGAAPGARDAAISSTRLVKEVIFGEAMLVSEKPGARAPPPAVAGRRLSRSPALPCSPARVCCGTAGSANQRQIDEMSAALTAYEQDRRRAAARSGGGCRPAAHACRCSTRRARCRTATTAGTGRRLVAAARPVAGCASSPPARATVYRHALERVLLPRLIWRLEAQMRGSLDRPDFLYEATRVYLMLGAPGPLDRDLVRAWMSLDWQAAYPGPAMAPMRQDLGAASRRACSPSRCRRSRSTARWSPRRARPSAACRSPIASIRGSPPPRAAQAVPPWRPVDALGAAGVRLFVRASGKPLGRRHSRLLHDRRLLQGAAAGARRRHRRGRERKLGARRPRRDRPGQRRVREGSKTR